MIKQGFPSFFGCGEGGCVTERERERLMILQSYLLFKFLLARS